ncbi:TAP-like protein-domain-containing protein [Xylariales sp. PMI_506]|nr:TAP-like protein-domain-containing protein [Xylariales sp. PMI_506]
MSGKGESRPMSAAQQSRSSKVLQLATMVIALAGVIRYTSFTRYFEHSWPYVETGSQVVAIADNGWVNWDSIEPSENLIWHSCLSMFPGSLKCARLTVPMDYHRPLNASLDNPKVHIALVMSPGPGRTDDPTSYGTSPILINPGGPGGSGVMFAASQAVALRAISGGDHDIIGFDPRGVGATTPKADCFEVPNAPPGMNEHAMSTMNRLTWIVSGHDVGLPNSSNIALAKVDVRHRAETKLCAQVSDTYGKDSIFKFAGTPNVARDMLSIVHAWDSWRLGAKMQPELTKTTHSAVAVNQSSDSPPDTQGKLVFWGFSYGTLLGATFASMFPDKVGRLILDGVVDADNYVTPMWMESLLDSDKILEKLFEYCHAGGLECPLYRPGDTQTQIKERYLAALQSLRERPRIVSYPGVNMPIIVTESDVKPVIFLALYSPYALFPVIAEFLNTIITDAPLHPFVFPVVLQPFCGNITIPIWPDDAQKAVMCSDKRYKLNDTSPELQKRFDKLGSVSSFADVWMQLMMGCNGWSIESNDPPMRWDDHPAHHQGPIETDFPILFLSNHYDPVTPLHAALKMTQKFANASIVEQLSEGHCTLSCASLCTMGHIRTYLNEGKVPQAPKFDGPDSGTWATCECPGRPWQEPTSSWVEHQGSEDSSNYGGSGSQGEFTAQEAQWISSWRDIGRGFTHQLMEQVIGKNSVLKGAVINSLLEGRSICQKQQCKLEHSGA